jgi:RHS repeat-associated protein
MEKDRSDGLREAMKGLGMPPLSRRCPPNRGRSNTPFGLASDRRNRLTYLIHRYYDPQTGQFLTVDPLLDQTGQPYTYAADDPINADDPDGAVRVQPWGFRGGLYVLALAAAGPCLLNPAARNSGGQIVVKKVIDLINEARRLPPSGERKCAYCGQPTVRRGLSKLGRGRSCAPVVPRWPNG